MTTDMTQDDKEHIVKELINEPKAMAKQRLMDFAASLPTDSEDGESEVTYTELIDRATEFQEHGSYWSEGGRFEGQSMYEGFWDDFKLVTNIEVNDTYGFFSCSC